MNEAGPTQVVDVVVVGAGIGGLATARLLDRAGRRLRVLEARPRLGGRLHAVEVGDRRLDLGATWFWPGERRVAGLVAELGIATHAQHLAGDALFHDRPSPQRIDGNPLDVSSSRFSDSAVDLVDAVAASLPEGTISTDTVVTRIERGADGVRVIHGDTSTAGSHVVVAVPPATAVRSITIEPPLPERIAGLAANTPVWMGAIAKAVAVYETPFWREAGLAGGAISHLGPLRELHDMSGPDAQPAALFGFAPLGTDGTAPSTAAVVAQLVELFGPAAAAPLEVVVQDWRAEPFTSAPGVAGLTAYQTYGHEWFAEPVDGRLHWASTETGAVAPGHIEGALAAAERTAERILTS